MDIIFCDVDGVLNSITHLIEVYNLTGVPHSNYEYPFDEKCLNNLKLLVNDNTRIVITSKWRKDDEGINRLTEELEKYNLNKYVIGYTPILDTQRGEEIKAFMEITNINIEHFVILDDDRDMCDLIPYLVKTNTKVGLTYEDVLLAKEVLRKDIQIKLKKEFNFNRKDDKIII